MRGARAHKGGSSSNLLDGYYEGFHIGDTTHIHAHVEVGQYSMSHEPSIETGKPNGIGGGGGGLMSNIIVSARRSYFFTFIMFTISHLFYTTYFMFLVDDRSSKFYI